MLLIDEDDWPLVLLRWDPPVGVMDVGLYRVRFEDWLRRDRPFAVLSIQPANPTIGSLHDVVHAPVWSGELRHRTAQRCAALACVVPDGRLHDTLAEAQTERLQQLIGCSVGCFHDGDEALRWLRGCLRGFQPPSLLSDAGSGLSSQGSGDASWPL
jgi:hypothetical protein